MGKPIRNPLTRAVDRALAELDRLDKKGRNATMPPFMAESVTRKNDPNSLAKQLKAKGIYLSHLK